MKPCIFHYEFSIFLQITMNKVSQMNNKILCASDTWNINHLLLQNNVGFQIPIKISVVKFMNLPLNYEILKKTKLLEKHII